MKGVGHTPIMERYWILEFNILNLSSTLYIFCKFFKSIPFLKHIICCLEGNPLFDSNHAISLALEGRLVPRRKPGRPRKLKPNDSVGETIDSKSNDEIPEDIVDPEHALELMFKEAEEKRQSTGDVSQTRRRRRIPQRFANCPDCTIVFVLKSVDLTLDLKG